MKVRIITAAVAIPLLLLLVLAAPAIVPTIVYALMMAIAAYELLGRTGLIRNSRLVIYSCVMAAAICFWSYLGSSRAWAMLGMLVFCILLFSEMMRNHVKVRFEHIGLCFFGGVIMPYLLTALIRILVMQIGQEVIVIPFLIAFLSDGGAYFVGLKFGRHKLSPVVSPNKTIEGMLGGMAAATVGMLLYALIMQFGMRFQVNYGLAILYGLAGSLAGTAGDLCFSVIKRQTGIKDYGFLFPGHGGVLDRFDSMMTVAPLVEALLILLPLAV